MKTLLYFIIFSMVLSPYGYLKAQTAQSITFNGGSHPTGEDVEVKCESNYFYVSTVYNRANGGGSANMTLSTSDVSAPGGYTVSSFSPYTLLVQYTNPQQGDFIVTGRDGSYSYTFTIHAKSAPHIQIAGGGNGPVLYSNQTGTVAGFSNQSIQPYSYVTWYTNYGLRVEGGSSYVMQNSGNNYSVNISTTNSGGTLYAVATNNCGSTRSPQTLVIGPPYIENPNLTLFDAYSNVWQFTQVWHSPSTTYSFNVVSGSATLSQNTGDCYITTSGGADVCVTGTNTYGTCDPYCFYVPGGGGYMRAASPNPAKDKLTLQFTNTESLKSLPSDIYLYPENSTNAVRSVSVKDIYDRKAFEDGDKINLSVGDLPRGVYYVHAIPSTDSKLSTQKIRVILE